MVRIAQEISAIYVVDINVVRIEPADWPRIDYVEPIPAVLKASRSAVEFATVHMKRVVAAKTLMEAGFRNVPAASAGLGPTRLL